MTDQTTIETVGTGDDKRIRVRRVHTEETDIHPSRLPDVIAALDQRIAQLERELADVKAQRDQLAAQTAEFEKAQE